MYNKNPDIGAEQLALILNVSVFTVKRLAKTSQIPCTYKNRQPRFDLQKLKKHFQKIERGAI